MQMKHRSKRFGDGRRFGCRGDRPAHGDPANARSQNSAQILRSNTPNGEGREPDFGRHRS